MNKMILAIISLLLSAPVLSEQITAFDRIEAYQPDNILPQLAEFLLWQCEDQSVLNHLQVNYYECIQRIDYFITFFTTNFMIL